MTPSRLFSFKTLPSTSFKTLDDTKAAFGGVYPGFLFLRHALSVIILAHHSRILLRGFEERHLSEGGTAHGAVTDGLISALVGSLSSPVEMLRPLLYALVGAFFALSGFLVTGSATRTRSVGPFLGLRGLRIFPALCSEILLSAFVLGPLVTSLMISEYFADPKFWHYFLNILGIVQYELPGVFTQNPVPNMVNANLWTLGPEFYCYLLMAVAIGTGILYRRGGFLICLIVAVAALTIATGLGMVEITTRLDTTRFSRWFIVYMFMLGVLLSLYSDKVPVNIGLFIASSAAYIILMYLKKFDLIAGVFLAYCTIFLGTIDLSRFDRLFKSDYSYGIYLYGYPITQALIFILFLRGYIGQSTSSALVLAILSLAITIAFSHLSWHFIEKPALSLRRYVVRQKAPAAPLK